MEKKKLGYDDFIATVNSEDLDFVNELNELFVKYGCKLQVKEAKSGLVASYLLGKRSVANYVFRKKGLFIRIYPGGLDAYLPFLETLPEGMAKAVADAPVCKRLVDPYACNSKCPMGYQFTLKGERHQKCRYSAFFFLLCPENNPTVKAFLEKELEASA